MRLKFAINQPRRNDTMKVTIHSADVNEKPWSKGDRSGLIRTQEAIVETPRFRNTVRLDLGKNPAYPVGDYTCDLEDNLTVNNFGDLTLARRLKLNPVIAAARRQA